MKKAKYRKQPWSKYVLLARERHQKDLEKSKDESFPYYYDEKAADRAVWFISQLKHFDGEWAGKPFVLSDWQEFDIVRPLFGWKKKEDGFRRFRYAYIEVARKNGKGLALSTPIPTPTGWTTMGQLVKGDLVIDDKGEPCAVNWVSEDRFLDCYEVEFSNGEKIVCDGDHLWETTVKVNEPGGDGKIKSRYKPPKLCFYYNKYAYAKLYRRQVFLGKKEDSDILAKFERLAKQDLIDFPVIKSNKTRIRETREIFKTQRYGKRKDVNHSVKLNAPLNLPQRDLLIEPYVLGAWLGDGDSGASCLTSGKEDVAFMSSEIVKRGYEVSIREDKTAHRIRIINVKDGQVLCGRKSGTFLHNLRELGVYKNKHIPNKYLRASKSQRLDLLCGLMDTDGTINKDGDNLAFTTTSLCLRDGVAELLSSLGIKFSIKEKKLRCNGRELDGVSWTLQFHVFKDLLPVFKMPRKLNRMKLFSRCSISPRSQSLQIVNIKKIDSVITRCISVNSPSHMFLCGERMIPTHNSQMSAAIALYLQLADKEPGAQIFVAATKEEQARIVWGQAAKIIERSPFSKEVEIFKKSIYCSALNSVLIPLGRDSRTQDGFSVHGGIVDEYHAHKNAEMLNVLASGRGARRQPLILIITTAGHENGGPCKSESDRMKKLLKGELENHEIFAFIATVDNEEDWRNEDEWIKANPNLGISIYLEGFRSSYRETAESPSKINEFQVKNLNIWKENVSRWIKSSSYDALDKTPINLEELKGRRCFAGLDLGVSQDISVLSLVFYMKEPEEGEEHPEVLLLNKYWIPGEAVRERYLNDGVRYPDWVAEGWLKTTEGATTRYDIIRNDINELASMFEIAEIAVDQAHAAQLMVQLSDDGHTMVKHSQSLMAMSFPTKSLQELILSNKLKVGNDPVFRWMVLNTIVVADGNGNIKPMKNKSEEKIDGVVSAAMAVGRLLVSPMPQKFIYNERSGIFFG